MFDRETSIFFSGSPHHHHHHVRHSCVGFCCFHSCIRYLLVSDTYMAASWFLSVHLDSMSCGLASHSVHSCQVSGSPHTTLTCSTINILLTFFTTFLSSHLSTHQSILGVISKYVSVSYSRFYNWETATKSVDLTCPRLPPPEEIGDGAGI